MRTTSLFCADCVCGRYFEAEEREYTCPNCKRFIILAWGTDVDLEQENERDADVPEVAA